jgi:hypothetical protein
MHPHLPPPVHASPSPGDDEIYTNQLPLPLTELYDSERPGSGVVALLKYALWHVLWVEAAPSPGEKGRGVHVRGEGHAWDGGRACMGGGRGLHARLQGAVRWVHITPPPYPPPNTQSPPQTLMHPPPKTKK